MRGVRGILVVVLASAASGCAGGRTHQDLAHLQSQVGMLEERVTQLERSGIGTASTVPLTEAVPDAVTGGEVTIKVKKKHAAAGAKPSHAEKTAESKASVKPSTREVQQALKNAGFYQGSVDGKMGPKTKSAVKEFQRVHGLTDDGVVGRQTWSKLQSYANLSANSSETAPAEPVK